jgi:hypothetical protein
MTMLVLSMLVVSIVMIVIDTFIRIVRFTIFSRVEDVIVIFSNLRGSAAYSSSVQYLPWGFHSCRIGH